MKILLPLDLVQPITPLIDQLVSLVDLAKSELKLLFVNETLPAYENVIKTAGNFADDWTHEMERKAQQVFSEAKRLLSPHCSKNTKITHEIVSGSPAMMIVAIARDGLYDITVIAPGSHSVVESFFLGSVTSKVIKHGIGTTLIIRSKNKELQSKPAKVLIATDGSSHAKRALVKSLSLFRLAEAGVKITLVYVVDITKAVKFFAPVEFVSCVEQNLLMEGEVILAESQQVLMDNSIKNVDCQLKEGNPATEIIRLAEKISADLLILGARGSTDVQHFLLGSVSQRVAMHAPCSTAIVQSA